MTVERAKQIAEQELRKVVSKLEVKPYRPYDVSHGVEKHSQPYSINIRSLSEEQLHQEILRAIGVLEGLVPGFRMSGAEFVEHERDTVVVQNLRLTFVDGRDDGFRIEFCYYPSGVYDWGDDQASETVVSTRKVREA